jgi:hypothetical protein
LGCGCCGRSRAGGSEVEKERMDSGLAELGRPSVSCHSVTSSTLRSATMRLGWRYALHPRHTDGWCAKHMRCRLRDPTNSTQTISQRRSTVRQIQAIKSNQESTDHPSPAFKSCLFGEHRASPWGERCNAVLSCH